MKTSKCIFLLVFLLSLGVPTHAFTKKELPTVYIAPMENDFDTFIAAALLKKKVPLEIITDADEADFIIAGVAVQGNNEWYDTVSAADGYQNGSGIKLLKTKDKSIVWTGATDDRSLPSEALKPIGNAKTANRLALQLKKFLAKKAKEDAKKKRRRVKETKHKLVIEIRVVRGANSEIPVKLDLLLVKDEKLLKELSEMSASEWFNRRQVYRVGYPKETGLSAGSWELVPEESTNSYSIPLKGKFAGGIIFADYYNQRAPTVSLDLRESVVVELGKDDIAVTFLDQ